MTQYQRRVENYGPGGLINVETPTIELTGEAEQAYLSPDRVKNAYQTLRQWSVDAATNHTNWPTMTNAQKDAAQRETIRRLGILMDRLADLLLLEGRT
jgi:hypothetical protein